MTSTATNPPVNGVEATSSNTDTIENNNHLSKTTTNISLSPELFEKVSFLISEA